MHESRASSPQALSPAERALYHQIHPAKLLTDIGATIPALYFGWQRKLVPALVISFLPAAISSAIILKTADLEPYKESALGKYLRKYMTPAMQALRLCGFGIMMVGTWLHKPWVIGAGFATVLFGW